ncbi:MAG: hypothetical protein M1391_10600 [Bacteroidetes bacterium]|nr:hypothetical protein [Bacteroidota bacterium]
MKSISFTQFKLLLIATLIVGCSSSAIFNQKAYEQATSLKVDVLNLMDKATGLYADNEKEINELKINVEKAYQYCLGLPNNDETIKQWEIIKDPERNSIMGFLKRWEAQKQLKRDFIDDAKSLVSDGFDQIIGLESGKVKK